MAALRWLLLLVIGLWPWAAPAAPSVPPPEVPLGQVFGLLEREYAPTAPARPLALLRGAMDEAARAIPELVYTLEGEPPTRLHLRVDDAGRRFALEEPRTLAALRPLLDDVAAFVTGHRHGGAEAVPGAPALLAQGLLEALDAHSGLLRSDAHGRFQSRARGRFGGVGLILGEHGGRVVVRYALDGSPARQAGLLPGDRLLQVDGHPVGGGAVEVAESLLRGEAGTAVRLLVRTSDDDAARQLTLRREDIRFASVDAHLFAGEGQQRIGYLRILSFQESTSDELRDHLRRFRPQRPGMGGVILDLRGNPGGLLEQSIRVADLFLERGTIAVLRRPRGRSETVRAHRFRSLEALPLVVLVDGATASAAELVAGALKANRRAVVLGTPTHGKRSIQSVFRLSRRDAVKLTVAHFAPAGEPFAPDAGVTPHVRLAPVRVLPGRAGTRGLLEAARSAAGPEAAGRNGAGGPPLVVLPYLEARSDPRARDGMPLPPPGDARRRWFADDLPLALARRLLAGGGGREFALLLHEAAALAREERRRQRARIGEALEAMAADWSARAQAGGGQVELVRARLLHRPGPGTPWRLPRQGLQGGDQVLLRLTVRNRGTTPAARVLAVVSATEAGFPALELPVGRLAPGAMRQVEGRVGLPGVLPAGLAGLRVALHDGRPQLHYRATLYVPLRGRGGDDAVLSLTPPPARTPLPVVQVRGTAQPRRPSTEVLVSLNGRKVHYDRDDSGRPLRFSVGLHLAPGRNLLRVEARNGHSLVHSRTFVVWHQRSAGFPLAGLPAPAMP